MKKVLAMCLGVMILCVCTPPLRVFAQAKYTVNGVVVDNSGNPIIGASVVEQGTVNGVTTDIDGAFAITVKSPQSVVEVSYIGYKTVQRVASSTDLARLVLEEDLMALDEVVVIGYGAVKKNDMTGSVATVKADQLNKGLVSSPADLMLGKSAGVVVTPGTGQPGSAATIRVRGASSLSAQQDPMIVVDGLPVSNSGIDGVSSALASINPSDIESFTILKDASATAIYGSRASNGVIIITTKKGSGNDSAIPHVAVDFTASLSQNAKYVDVMTGDQMRAAMEQFMGGTDNDAYRALGTANTDWQKQIYQLAQSYDTNISLTGNVKMGEKNRMPYRVSFGYINQDGTLRTDNMTRETLTVNLNPILLDNHLNISLNAKGMNMDSRFANQDAVGQAVQFDPTQPVYDPDGLNGYWWWNNGRVDAEGRPDHTVANSNTMATQNPLALLKDKRDESNAKRFIGNAQVDYRIHGLEDLRLNLNLGLDYVESTGTVDVASNTEQSMHDKTQSGSGYHRNYSQRRRDQTLEFYADYNKTIGRHTFDVMAGYSWQHFYKSSFGETYKADGTEPDAPGYYISNPKTSKTEYYLVSFFGRVNYAFDSRYMITATVRNDGTSRFSENKWGLFPSVALGWNISNEPFMRDVRAVSNLKLRLSWGQTGQQDLNAGDYPTLATYIHNTDASLYPFGTSWKYPITPAGYNADLKWETTTTYNAGLDYGFLDGRIYGSIDFYKRKTKDLLNWTPIAAGANLANYLNANIGDLENTGVEFEINAVPIQTKDWTWTIGFNTAWNKNKITRLTSDDEREDYYGVDTGGISGGVGVTCQVQQTGQPLNSFYVYQQVYDENGLPMEGVYVDRNGDGKVDSKDKYCYKKAAPDVTFGFNTAVSWRALTLAVSAHANVGNYVYANVESNGGSLRDLWLNNFVSNRHASAMATGFTEAQYLSDYYVRNASFLKLDNITLSYRFDLRKSSKRPMNLSIFGTVQNVATISGYKGIDPEIFSGIDNNFYPRPRTYMLGLKFNF